MRVNVLSSYALSSLLLTVNHQVLWLLSLTARMVYYRQKIRYLLYVRLVVSKLLL